MSSAEDALVIGVYSLPSELLLKILVPLCVDGDPKAPWTLATVCFRWRQVLLATPSVWRVIRIISDKWTNQTVYNGSLSLLELQLSRSESRQLDVHLDIGDFRSHSGFRPDLKQISTLLQRSAPFPCWKALFLTRCSRGMLDQIHLDSMGGFTNLESFVLNDLLDPFVPIVDSTVTNSLKRFDFLPPFCPMDGLTFTQTVPGILSRIVDRFILPGWFNGPTTGLHLPPNIKKLRIYSGTLPDTNFPHVESLIFQSAVSFFVDKLPDCFPNLKTLILSATNLPDPDFFLLVELPHLEHLTTHKFGYAHLNRLSAPRLQTLTLYLSGSGAAMPSWMKEKTIQISDLGNPADYIGMNISPQRELAFLLPVSLPTLNSFLRCTSKFKHLGVLFVGDDARTLLTTMFRSTEGYLQERKGGEPEFWEASVHLERLGLVLDCKMDEEQVVAWEECASRFYASRSAETRLRQLDVIWSCREKRRAKV